MANVLAMIKKDDSELRPYYQMYNSDVVPTTDSDFHAKVKKAFDELTDLKWLIEDISTNYFAIKHLLNTSNVKLFLKKWHNIDHSKPIGYIIKKSALKFNRI